ncbi:hypothetical protein G7Y89_g4049 [Cudoniella acicularis]|uniref:Uncharacterized protein n=1 Tax=Cudoniella acicularis TaxID=354080 RepID=A0A8H4RT73_9HELO|nr:hypothetical protein G7Y89_g4049 [Cudoniella acicularis]
MEAFRSLFGRSKNNTNTNTNTNSNTTTSAAKSKISNPIPINTNSLQSQSYEAAVALAPPVHGSYSIAGNGPSVLETIHRRQSNAGSIAANTSRQRDNPPEPVPIPPPPQTTPHDGTPGGGQSDGRTRSGFSVKSPPSFFSSSRKNSISSIRNPSLDTPRTDVSSPILPTESSASPTPRGRGRGRERTANKPAGRDMIPEGFTVPSTHNRSTSQVSRRHIDLLDAHSNITTNSRAQSLHRAKASGVRNYGEDVADRNIAANEHRLDLNAPEFSYLKHLYASHTNTSIPQPQSRKNTGVAATGGQSHALASPIARRFPSHDTRSDDTRSPVTTTRTRHERSSSIRSATSQSRTPAFFPPRTDSATSQSYSANRGRHDDHSSVSNDSCGEIGRAISPTTTEDAPPARNPRRPSISSTNTAQTSNRARPVAGILKNPPPVALPSAFQRVTSPTPSTESSKYSSSHSRQTSNTSVTRGSSLASRRRTTSMSSQSTATPSHGRGGSKDNSISYTPSAGSSHSRQQSKANRESYIVQSSPNPIDLEGVVDLSNTVDTDMTKKALPAVTHEHVTPTRHEIRHERITRETHTHDVFHRILPVIETEILPTKNYVPSADGRGLVEIPEHMLPGRTENGSPSRNWEIVETGLGKGDHGAGMRSQQSSRSIRREIPREGAEAPVVGYVQSRHHSRGSSSSFSSRRKSLLEPILSSKKEYITKEGYPKTEYVWRHPPVFETADGKTTSVLLPAGFGESDSNYGEETDTSIDCGTTTGTITSFRSSGRGQGRTEEHLQYRDSGYGPEGMLPGLKYSSPMAAYIGRAVNESLEDDYEEQEPRNSAHAEGEATNALRRMRERRSMGLSVSQSAGPAAGSGSVPELEAGVRNMGVGSRY